MYREAAKMFGSERDSEVSADGIRRPRIEKLKRKTAGFVQSRGVSKYKVGQTAMQPGSRPQLELVSPGSLEGLTPRVVTRLSREMLAILPRQEIVDSPLSLTGRTTRGGLSTVIAGSCDLKHDRLGLKMEAR